VDKDFFKVAIQAVLKKYFIQQQILLKVLHQLKAQIQTTLRNILTLEIWFKGRWAKEDKQSAYLSKILQ
jgi:hypothetical protein